MLNKEQLKVLCNIIAAVESEGQVYHTQATASGYADFTEAYANTYAETAITLGRYQHYGTEALKLLWRIYDKDKSLFTDELLYDMRNLNWGKYDISKESLKARTIVKIISSQAGKDAQDELVSEQMQEYASHAEKLGVTHPWAQAMCANFEHQGGYGAVSRIISKTQRPYTLDNLYEATKSDTGNQVGAYRTRQACVYKFIKQYMPEGNDVSKGDDSMAATTSVTAETIIGIMRGWLGLNGNDGSHRQIVDLYNSYLPRARGYAVQYGDSWCDATVSAAFIKAGAVSLIGGTECGVEEHVKLFQKAGIWIEDGTITPQPGDIITFNWDVSMQPNDGFSDHIGIVEFVSDGVVNTIEGNSGNMVARRQYRIGHGNIRGYARPKYVASGSSSVQTSATSASTTAKTVSAPTSVIKKGSVGEEVRLMQQMLIESGYSCGQHGADGDFGDDTLKALKAFQKDNGMIINGYFNGQTYKRLVLWNAAIKSGEAYAAKSNVPVRSGPAKKNDSLLKIVMNKKVKVSGSVINDAGNVWYQVKVDGIAGWIAASNLKPKK